jgi:hypothetical protein
MPAPVTALSRRAPPIARARRDTVASGTGRGPAGSTMLGTARPSATDDVDATDGTADGDGKAATAGEAR